MRTRTKKIKIPHYESVVHVILSSNVLRKYKELVLKHPTITKLETLKKSDTIEAMALAEEDSVGVYWMLFPHKPSSATIVHECFHTTINITQDRSMDEEGGAYLMEYLFTEVKNFI